MRIKFMQFCCTTNVAKISRRPVFLAGAKHFGCLQPLVMALTMMLASFLAIAIGSSGSGLARLLLGKAPQCSEAKKSGKGQTNPHQNEQLFKKQECSTPHCPTTRYPKAFSTKTNFCYAPAFSRLAIVKHL